MLRWIPLIAMLMVLAALAFAMEANAGTFWQWTDDDGVVSVTDDVKRIPARYADRAVERQFEQIVDRRTPVTVPATEYEAALTRSLERMREVNARTTVNPNHLRDCTGPVTITKERRDYEERGQSLNSMFFVTRNACGDVISVTREQPRLRVDLER